MALAEDIKFGIYCICLDQTKTESQKLLTQFNSEIIYYTAPQDTNSLRREFEAQQAVAQLAQQRREEWTLILQDPDDLSFLSHLESIIRLATIYWSKWELFTLIADAKVTDSIIENLDYVVLTKAQAYFLHPRLRTKLIKTKFQNYSIWQWYNKHARIISIDYPNSSYQLAPYAVTIIFLILIVIIICMTLKILAR